MGLLKGIVGFLWLGVGAGLLAVGALLSSPILTILGAIVLAILAINTVSYGWGKSGGY